MNNSEQKKISRYGSYGILFNALKILLVLKRSGPYKGLLDLPGGAIEFGETPEEALRREILEETAFIAGDCSLLGTFSHFGEYKKGRRPYLFHHIGIIYRVSGITQALDYFPEEQICWINLEEISSEKLSPFAKKILNYHP